MIGIGIFVLIIIISLIVEPFWNACDTIGMLLMAYAAYAGLRVIFSSQRILYLIKVVVACVLIGIVSLVQTHTESDEHKAQRLAQQEQREQEEAQDAAEKAEKAEQEAKDKELQDAYDKQAQYEEWIAWQESEKKKEEDAALQDAYDKQAQYEEWMEWKKGQELQEAYDKQAQYEEWIAWQKQQQEAEEAERNKYQPIGAGQMMADYDSNGAAARSRYAGKYYRITGVVELVDAAGDGILISDGSGNSMCVISCERTPKMSGRSLQSLAKGQVVEVSGRVKSVGGEALARSSLYGDLSGYRVEINRID